VVDFIQKSAKLSVFVDCKDRPEARALMVVPSEE
jgi:hypothetical protein